MSQPNGVDVSQSKRVWIANMSDEGHESQLDMDDEQGFKYPEADGVSPMDDARNAPATESDEEDFTYPAEEAEPAVVHVQSEPGPSAISQSSEQQEQQVKLNPKPAVHVPPAQLEALYDAGLNGNLPLLKKLVAQSTSSGELEAFVLVNDASPRTGLTVLHAAASRGHLEIVRWLLEECGGIPDLEDKEGETALHKAALHGHLPVMMCLVGSGADVNARDGDGWTALHNAASKGYLDIVRWLCETAGAAGAANEVDGVRGVNARSKGGWTPLMNAASKGHLPVVLYLLSKQSADPLVRNDWGEAAYDVAAAVFEVWICEVLQRMEAEKWRNTTVRYDPLAVHTTIPIILYENQRLDVRLKTLAVNGGRPKFSVTGLGRKGRRFPFELRLPKPDEETGKVDIPAWRSDVQLPFIEDPFTLPKPSTRDGPSREGAERSHFWLSDWTVDLTHPRVDVNEGWQYSHSFDDAEDQWNAEPPPPLERLLSGSGIMTAGLGASTSRSNSSGRPPATQAWVRRRRWVRVMRRRLDIPPLPYLGPDGLMYQLSNDGKLIPYVSEPEEETYGVDGHELGAMPASFLSMSQDYVARSRYLAGTPSAMDPTVNSVSAVDVRRSIAKLERAVMELRMGILGDEDHDRRTQAEVLLNAYSRELERRRLAAGAAGITLTNDADDELIYGGEDSDDDSFHYPGSSPTASTLPRPPSSGSQRSQNTDYFNRPTITRTSTDLTPHLSQAPEFRVPTHEAPQKVVLPRSNTPTPHTLHAQWERDEVVTECRECRRRFTFLFRKHHCRRCGKIFCDRCSSYRVTLDPADIVHDPALPGGSVSPNSPQRVCQACFEETNASSSVPARFQGSSSSSIQRIVIDEDRLAIPTGARRSDSSSQLSDLAECPVCGRALSEFGSAPEQEVHVKNCLEGSAGTIQQPARYLVYRLPGESLLVGTECVICLEEFVKGSMVARLSCLCSFHNTCLSAWLQRGRSCPVHARDN